MQGHGDAALCCLYTTPALQVGLPIAQAAPTLMSWNATVANADAWGDLVGRCLLLNKLAAAAAREGLKSVSAAPCMLDKALELLPPSAALLARARLLQGDHEGRMTYCLLSLAAEAVDALGAEAFEHPPAWQTPACLACQAPVRCAAPTFCQRGRNTPLPPA